VAVSAALAVAALVTLIGGSSPAASRPGQCGVRTVPAYLLCFPSESKRRARIKPGDEVEFCVSGGIINIIPRLPTADDEYIVDEMIAHMKSELKKRAATRRIRRRSR